jgi:hypothetical protein
MAFIGKYIRTVMIIMKHEKCVPVKPRAGAGLNNP